MMAIVLQGRSPLWTAIFNGHLEVVKALIEGGANVNHTKVGVCVVMSNVPDFIPVQKINLFSLYRSFGAWLKIAKL